MKAVTGGLMRIMGRDTHLPLAFDVVDDGKAVFLRGVVPPSMRTQLQYVVHLAMGVDPSSNTVTEIDVATCTCKASAFEDCQHIAATLFTLHDIVRTSGRIQGVESVIQSSTSAACWWRAPTGKHSADCRYPIHHYMVKGRKAALASLGLTVEMVHGDEETAENEEGGAPVSMPPLPPTQPMAVARAVIPSTPARFTSPQVTLTPTRNGAIHTHFHEYSDVRFVEITANGARHSCFREDDVETRQSQLASTTASVHEGVAANLFDTMAHEPAAPQNTVTDPRPVVRKFVVKEEKSKRRSVGYDRRKEIAPRLALLAAHKPNTRKLRALALSLDFHLPAHQAAKRKSETKKTVVSQQQKE